VEETWAAGGTEEKIPLLKTFFFMTIKGIARCIFGKTFDDPALVNNLSKAYLAAWEEMEVRIGVSHTLAYHSYYLIFPSLVPVCFLLSPPFLPFFPPPFPLSPSFPLDPHKGGC